MIEISLIAIAVYRDLCIIIVLVNQSTKFKMKCKY